MTRKEKIAAGVEKLPKRKTLMAQAIKEEKAEIAKVMLRNYPGSPRKMRMIIDQIRGKEVFLALNVLKFTAKAGAPAVAKLLKSAIACYEEKFGGDRVDAGTHYVSTVYVDGGRMLKRMQPAPQGRGHVIRKRSCHVTLVIDKI
ncbi:MAG: 50S ribosomal protein L22 [Bacteroidia bacterium]